MKFTRLTSTTYLFFSDDNPTSREFTEGWIRANEGEIISEWNSPETQVWDFDKPRGVRGKIEPTWAMLVILAATVAGWAMFGFYVWRGFN